MRNNHHKYINSLDLNHIPCLWQDCWAWRDQSPWMFLL